MSALATVGSDRVFYITIADADIGSLKSLHTLFGRYLDHMLVNLNNIVWFKWLTISDKVLTPFWKTFLSLQQLFDA